MFSLTVYSWLKIVVVLVNTNLVSVNVENSVSISATLITFLAITFVFCNILVALALIIATSHAGF